MLLASYVLVVNPQKKCMNRLPNCFLKKDYIEAIPLYQQVLSQDPKNSNALVKLALCHYELQEWESAMQYANTALRYKAEFFEVYEILAIALESMNQIPAAEDAYKDILEKFPDRLESKADFAEFYIRYGKSKEALILYEELAEQLSEEKDYAFNVAFLAYQLKDYDKAEKFYKKVLELAPTEPNSNFGLGAIYDRQKKYDLALTYYAKAILKDPDHLSALYNTAQLHEKKHDKLKAIDAWQAYLKVAQTKTGQEKFVNKAKERIKALEG